MDTTINDVTMEEADFTQSGEQGTRQWFLTINNPDSDDLPKIPGEVFAVWQKEVGAVCGTPHIHATLIHKNAVSFNKVKATHPRADIQRVKKTAAAIKYCSKEDTRVSGPWERGERPTGHGKGKRTDLEEARDAIEDGADDNYMKDHHIHVVAKYPRLIAHLRALKEANDVEKEPLPDPLRPWMAEILRIAQGEPHKRKIYWYFDEEGGRGKSSLARHMRDFHNAFYCVGGKSMDITYSYNFQRIVIFDYVRDSQEYVNYGVMEMLKNGMVQSNKYESVLKRCNVPHIFVFANFMPNMSKMSMDRWDITDLSYVL